VYLIQDYCRRLGVGTSPGELADLAAVVQSLPAHHPLAVLQRGARDAAAPDALADALLNPRERAYSVPQFFELLDGAGLEFTRWYWQAPYLPQCGAIAATPHAGRLAALPERNRYAALELWRGTMTTHSALVAHRRTSAPDAAVRFDDEAWLDYVPIRLPSTLCVQERLPAGAAGVLLNRAHQFHDLILPIEPQEQRWFDAIDGHRRIRSILGTDAAAASARARAFFEKLWQYDQVVYDASGDG